jgi:hypothetical protein
LDKYAELKHFYNNMGYIDCVVTMSMMCIEFKGRNPDIEVLKAAFMKRIHRWMTSDNIVNQRVTHVAQNTRYDDAVIKNFSGYVNDQISSKCCIADCIVNIDETNVDFEMTGSVSLADAGQEQ